MKDSIFRGLYFKTEIWPESKSEVPKLVHYGKHRYLILTAMQLQITRLGEFLTEVEAAHAYDVAVRKMVGPNGEVNFTPEGKPVVKVPPGERPAPGVPMTSREQHNARRREKRRLANLAK